eukprot:scaffold1033_cov135-Isochrysis_galbana.AAC.7
MLGTIPGGRSRHVLTAHYFGSGGRGGLRCFSCARGLRAPCSACVPLCAQGASRCVCSAVRACIA